MATVTAPAPRREPMLSPKARLRLFWLKIHRWMGLTLLVFMFLFGVTGSALVWPDKFEALVHPARFPAASTAQFTPSETWLAKARAALPAGDRISGVRVMPGDGSILVAGQVSSPAPLGLGPPGRVQLWVHPQTGEVLDRQDGNLGLVWAMHAIHGHMLLKNVGREVVAVLGLFLVLMSAIGLWLWWPGAKAILMSLKWRKQFSKSMNLHRQTGAVLGVVMIVEAVTGAWIALPRMFENLIEPDGKAGRVQSEGPPRTPTLADPALSFERAVALARTAAGTTAPLITIFPPSEDRPAWSITFDGAAVAVDDASAVATVKPKPERTPAGKVTDMMEALHAGHTGPIWQMIVFLSGIVLALLSVTGILLWVQGRTRSRKRKPA